MRNITAVEHFVEKWWIVGFLLVLVLLGWVFGFANGLAGKVTGSTDLKDLSTTNVIEFKRDAPKRVESGEIGFRPRQLDSQRDEIGSVASEIAKRATR